ncbi:MAG TPA: type 2 isopentenyl-diphosphate Delta-isomerase [Paenibacillaceae bacterium]|nr:type 2 isopentenyl-diphosphate Delta-isomerase [Paenibacillaceae bacterium]
MSRSSRKKEHIQLTLREECLGIQSLDDVQFVHNCLPEFAMDEISLNTSIGGLQLSSPIIVNAMTGGANEVTGINEHLAMIARETKLAMAVGSQMAAIKDPGVEETYRVVRKANPKGIIFANIGSEATPEMAQKAVDMIEANGLQIHLNAVQELVMPEGDRTFKGVLQRIEKIVQALHVPVIIKEVGFGISGQQARKLAEIGVSAIDVGGKGGTNFARIENGRRENPMLSFNDWGISTASSLLEVSSLKHKIGIVSSGGIRTAIDVARGIALGASAAGIAGSFLHYAVKDRWEEGVYYAHLLHQELAKIMGALGVATVEQLRKVPVIIKGETYHWATMRGIDCRIFAQRGLD